MTWTKTDLAPPFPQEFQDLASTISSVAGTVDSALSPVITALNAASAFFTAATDIYQFLTQTIISESENFVNDFFGSGIYELILDPFSVPTKRFYEPPTSPFATRDEKGVPFFTTIDALSAALKSLDDEGDLNRPQFSDGAQIAAFGFLASAPNVLPLIELLGLLLKVWNIGPLELANRRVLEAVQGTGVQPRLPDWDSIRLNQIKPFGDMQVAAQKALALARGYTVVGDNAVSDLLDAISKKVQLLNDMSQIIALVAQAIVLAGSVSGTYVLSVPLGTGGTKRLKEAIQDAQTMINETAQNNFTIMGLYVGGAASAQPVENIRALLTS